MPAAAGTDRELNLDGTHARPPLLLALVSTLDRILSAPTAVLSPLCIMCGWVPEVSSECRVRTFQLLSGV